MTRTVRTPWPRRRHARYGDRGRLCWRCDHLASVCPHPSRQLARATQPEGRDGPNDAAPAWCLPSCERPWHECDCEEHLVRSDGGADEVPLRVRYSAFRADPGRWVRAADHCPHVLVTSDDEHTVLCSIHSQRTPLPD